jgi:isoleucyl-tRNA synthetase
VEAGDEVYILAEGLLSKTLTELGIEKYQMVGTFPGSTFEGLKCRHPFIDRESLLILGTHVTLEAGTGCVHTAPGHGQEDYEVGLKYGLDIYTPVDDDGKFTKEVDFFAGEFVFKANKAITKKLQEVNALLKEETITHSYPHCWRCKNPIVFRATEQWFISMDKNHLREKTLKEIMKVNWIPHWGRERIHNMVENRPDWCISRQRIWGVPITIFYCKKCHQPVANQEITKHVADLFEQHGADIWFSEDAVKLLPSGTSCPQCGGTSFDKETDILDVWFDSGVSYAAVLEKSEHLAYPADLYLEGNDQHRGWFHSSLLTSVETRNQAPYKSVLTHGFVVDGKGEKMAKSKGNVIAPEKIIKSYGVEILRLWVASEDYREDIRISDEILKRLSESYRKIRNTCRFLLGNLYDFDPQKQVEYHELKEIDRWALHRLYHLTARVTDAYSSYEFHTIYHLLHNFCVTDMSAIYLDTLKDTLYCSSEDNASRKAAQTVMFHILTSLVKLMAPILPFTAEEIWRHLPSDEEREESVHLSRFPQLDQNYSNTQLYEKWQILFKVRDVVLKVLEEKRTEKIIGNSLEAEVSLRAPDKLFLFLKECEDILEDLFITAKVTLLKLPSGEDLTLEASLEALEADVSRTPAEKCERCWKYSATVGENPDHPAICHRCAQSLKR